MDRGSLQPPGAEQQNFGQGAVPANNFAPQAFGQAPSLPQGSQPEGPAVPILLAPATRSIVPASSKASPEDQTKQLAVQFLNADNETQAKMLRDPEVARAILATLGEQGTGAP